MSWRTAIDAAYARRAGDARARYDPPAVPSELRRVEGDVGCVLPAEFAGLLLETNGFIELIAVDGDWIEDMWVVWTAEETRRRNMALRRGAHGFPGGALAFADAGADGIIFGLDLSAENPGVFAWYPITSERREMASSLREFLPAWIAGDLTV